MLVGNGHDLLSREKHPHPSMTDVRFQSTPGFRFNLSLRHYFACRKKQRNSWCWWYHITFRKQSSARCPVFPVNKGASNCGFASDQPLHYHAVTNFGGCNLLAYPVVHSLCSFYCHCLGLCPRPCYDHSESSKETA